MLLQVNGVVTTMSLVSAAREPEPVVTCTLEAASRFSRSVTFRTAPLCVGVHTPAAHTMFLVAAAEIVTAACAPIDANTAVAASSNACGFFARPHHGGGFAEQVRQAAVDRRTLAPHRMGRSPAGRPDCSCEVVSGR